MNPKEMRELLARAEKAGIPAADRERLRKAADAVAEKQAADQSGQEQ